MTKIRQTIQKIYANSNKKFFAVTLMGIMLTSGMVGAMTMLPNDKYLAHAQETGPGVMEQKLSQSIQSLGTCSNDAVCEQAINEIMESLFMSNLVPLPTAGVGETEEMFVGHQKRIQKAIAALSEVAGTDRPGAVVAAEARNFLQVTLEANQVIAEQTRNCDATAMQDFVQGQVPPKGCELLAQPDEGNEPVTNADGIKASIIDILPGFAREVRSPFFYGFPYHAAPHEKVMVTEPIDKGQCAVIVKETQGVKVVVRPILIPIWVEPWYDRARIVGYDVVWVWEYVPAEFVKSISYCKKGANLVQDVDMDIILDRPLMHFWKFLGKSGHHKVY